MNDEAVTAVSECPSSLVNGLGMISGISVRSISSGLGAKSFRRRDGKNNVNTALLVNHSF